VNALLASYHLSTMSHTHMHALHPFSTLFKISHSLFPSFIIITLFSFLSLPLSHYFFFFLAITIQGSFFIFHSFIFFNSPSQLIFFLLLFHCLCKHADFSPFLISVQFFCSPRSIVSVTFFLFL